MRERPFVIKAPCCTHDSGKLYVRVDTNDGFMTIDPVSTNQYTVSTTPNTNSKKRLYVVSTNPYRVSTTPYTSLVMYLGRPHIHDTRNRPSQKDHRLIIINTIYTVSTNQYTMSTTQQIGGKLHVLCRFLHFSYTFLTHFLHVDSLQNQVTL